MAADGNTGKITKSAIKLQELMSISINKKVDTKFTNYKFEL